MFEHFLRGCNTNNGPLNKLSEMLGLENRPRYCIIKAAQEEDWNSAAEHLGRATRRTANHALANWQHATAWSIIFVAACNMHPPLTLGMTVVGTALCARYSWSDYYISGKLKEMGVEEVAHIHNFQRMCRTCYLSAEKVRTMANEDTSKLAAGALIIAMAALAKLESPMFCKIAWPVTLSTALLTSFAASSYLAQEP